MTAAREQFDPALARVAARHGVELEYYDVDGALHRARPDVVREVLDALGVDTADDAAGETAAFDPVVVAWDGTAPTLFTPVDTPSVDILLALEGGPVRQWRADAASAKIVLPGDLPMGRHRLVVTAGDREWSSIVISAPLRCHRGQHGPHAWGGFLPLNSLRTERDWGIGDVTDLDDLAVWLSARGATIVSTLPLLAAFLRDPVESSPYAPVSRLFWNEIYIDAERLAGRDMAVAAPRSSDRVDCAAVAAYKRAVLGPIAEREANPEFARWVNERPDAVDYARFRAAGERAGRDWRKWNPDWRKAIPDDAVEPSAVRWHLWSQWVLEQQLLDVAARARSRGQTLLLDLPLGTHANGYDTWRYPDLFVADVSLGAPPDTFYNEGQNWGLAPIHPERSRRDGHGFFGEVLDRQLQVAGLLRIDHVMGLHRQYWIPAGRDATDGVYVRFPSEELWAVTSLLSHQHEAAIAGEDLGTVPDEVRSAMAEHGALGLFVAQWDITPPRRRLRHTPPEQCVASLNTHDMPPFGAWWPSHVSDQADADPDHVAVARDMILRDLATSPAAVLLVSLEDLWLETTPQNVPGTVGGNNWVRRARYTLEEIGADPQLDALLNAIDGDRHRSRVTPSRTTPLLATDVDLFLLNEGTHANLPDRFGAHIRPGGAVFSVWAPNARAVRVVGDGPGWDEGVALSPRGVSGVWEGFAPGASPGQRYKFRVQRRNGTWTERADPLARAGEGPPGNASIIDEDSYHWGDTAWMSTRGDRHLAHRPLSIYEVHLGSWRRVPEEGNRWLTFAELAPRLADHVEAHGFTHVELLPVMEHPYFASWGYQVTGFFQPSARYGSPDELRSFVDHLHQRGIGVIFDWVPAHFPADPFALAEFDGTHLYEHADPRQGRHPDWGSLIFNYGRHEVCSFLASSACWWMDSFHADGLRVDAVASMLYRDYSRAPGEWLPNAFGGRENLEALAFIRRTNDVIRSRFPDALVIAEESTAWPGVTAPTEWGGLGFHYKWDLGWMHDTLDYFSREPIHRRWHQSALTFRAIYAESERFVLALSHDEVVHGKGSLLSKMPGDRWQKFANLRLLLGYQHALPGKKLLFMGAELGQWSEWNHDGSLDWHLLDSPEHRGISRWLTYLNALHRSEPALHERDRDGGFSWISCNDAENSVLVLGRHAQDPARDLVIAANFTPVPREGYRIGLPHPGRWTLLADSDAPEFGGSGSPTAPTLEAESLTWDGRPWSAMVTLPPLGIVVYRRGS